MGAGYRLDDVMGMTLRSAVWFGILASDRKRAEMALQAIGVRNAFGADKDGFKNYLKELEHGNE